LGLALVSKIRNTGLLLYKTEVYFTVVNTSTGKFYFTKNGDSWKIGFIDLRVPCEA